MNDAKLQRISHIAEIISSIAVVISLIYIGLEITSNTRALQASIRQAFSAQEIAFISSAIDPSVVAQANSKFRRGEELTPLEEDQLVARQFLNFQIFNHAFYQYQVGALEESELIRYMLISRNNLCNNEYAVRAYGGRQSWRADFQAWSELVLANCEMEFEDLLILSGQVR